MRRAFIAVLCLALAACGGAQARRDWYLSQGRQYMAASDFERARIAFHNALYIDPANTRICVLTAEAAERSGKLREAAQLYKRAIDRDPRQLHARARLGRLYALAGDIDKALATIEPGLAAAPDDPDLRAVRGVVRLRKGDEKGAYEDAAHAVKIAPAN